MISVLLADGFEEIEALTPVDMLRRAGLTVKTIGISGKIAHGAHGIDVVCDALGEEADPDETELLILPGGMPGSINLDSSEITDRFISSVTKRGGRIAAICAAPLVLGRRGLLSGKHAVCYPGFESELKGAIIDGASVVTDGLITTAKGMGAALKFAHELVALMTSPEMADELSASVFEE